MRWLLCVAVTILSTQATSAQPLSENAICRAVDAVPDAETARCGDPTDYRAVVENLERARQSSVVERLLRAMPADTAKRFSLSRRFRAGYRRETGPLVAATLVGRYRKGAVKFDSGVSVKGWYCLRLSGHNLLNGGATVIGYDAFCERFPTYFYGLGYWAIRHNSRTTYYRMTQSVGWHCAQQIFGQLWADVALRYGRDEARRLSSRGVEYLQQANQRVLSVTTTALSFTLRYDSGSLADSLRRGISLKLRCEVRPRWLGGFSHTLRRASLVFRGFCPLWRGAEFEGDINCELLSRATPWLLWPSVGNDDRLKIYSYGRYVDRNMLAAHITLHQRVYGPVGCEVWCGAVNMFSTRVVWHHTLPSYGLGVRVVSDKGLTIRAGYGFGRHTHGVVIGVNERF